MPTIKRINPNESNTAPETGTKLEIPPEGVTADVTEVEGPRGKTRTTKFSTQVKPNADTQTNTNGTARDTSDDDEGYFDLSTQPDYQEIKKNPLEIMFEMVREIDPYGRESFFASVTRNPDNITDRFHFPCNTQFALGVFQFTINDQFNFIPEIQRLNGNSGGRFTVAVYTSDQKPATVDRTFNFNPRQIEIGIPSLYVANPMVTPTTDQPQSNQSDLGSAFTKLAEMQAEQHRQTLSMIQQMQQGQGRSAIEEQIMQAALQKMLHPETPQANSSEKMIEGVLTSVGVITAMSDAFAKGLNRETPTPPAPTLMEQATELGNSPIGQTLINRIMDIGEAIAISKLPGATNPAPATQTETETDSETVDGETLTDDEFAMKVTIDKVIAELESDRPLDTDNEMLADLAEKHPQQLALVEQFCKSMEFPALLNMLITAVDHVKPESPFIQFLDIEATQQKKAYVWNTRGTKLLTRLDEFYKLMRETSPESI